jgi:hypothetical protein
VQNPVTLVMSARTETRQALRAEVDQPPALPAEDDPVTTARNSIGTVHFAWFVYLDEERLAMTTTSEGDFERCIMTSSTTSDGRRVWGPADAAFTTGLPDLAGRAEQQTADAGR